MRYVLALSIALFTLTGVASAQPTAQITVYAAASLTDVFPKIDPRQKYSFAASNTLAQQIRQGAPADVFASADLPTRRRSTRPGFARRRASSRRTSSSSSTPSRTPAT